MVWIEIITLNFDSLAGMSPPARVVWIEIGEMITLFQHQQSPPARVVWIEIVNYEDGHKLQWSRHPRGWCGLKLLCVIRLPTQTEQVATREGGVD